MVRLRSGDRSLVVVQPEHPASTRQLISDVLASRRDVPAQMPACCSLLCRRDILAGLEPRHDRVERARPRIGLPHPS
jgi:hypothetical protein